jgi:CRP-like cAMP-binding protein
VEDNGRLIIRAGFNQSDLANQLAASRESINKQLKSFVSHGYILMEGHDIIVLDRDALQRLSEPSEAA